MRKLAGMATLLAAACSSMSASEGELPVRGETPGQMCRDEGLTDFVGQAATSEVGAEILRRSGAATLRWIPEDSAVTMDFRMDRVNVRLDRQNRIVSVDCG